MKPNIKIFSFIFLSIFSSIVNAQTNTAQTTSISANPATVNNLTGTGALQSYIEKRLRIRNDHGIRVGGLWIADTNKLFSGGIPDAKKLTSNNLVLLNLSADTEKLMGWKGGLFSVEFLNLNAQDVNGQAATVQGYNSIPGPQPLNRSELYQFWYRQELFEKKLILRIGKSVPTYDFTNVVKPVVINQDQLYIPAVSGLIYTPLFVNPTTLGVMPGFYNSTYGITVNFIPTKTWYLSYGVYDGNLANGTQTGTRVLPTLNGSYFHIAETGTAWLLGKNYLPGNVGVGVWHQAGEITSSPTLTENQASGFYLFGAQRVWYKHPGIDASGISIFYQYGLNNSEVLPIKKYVGGGVTVFGLIPHRIDDSIGMGAALSWLNQKSFQRATELVTQAYYQAKIINGIYLEPALSYIPTPGASTSSSAVWAGTIRAIILF